MQRTIRKPFYFFILFFNFLCAQAQIDEAYLKANAVQIDDLTNLNDDIYQLLSPFRIIMFGEMHGTNESAPFVNGLADLFSNQGDSVLVGLEIPPELMQPFLSNHTESSIYESEFFKMPALSGKESFPWAHLIADLNKRKNISLFFFDVNDNEKIFDRDSIMAMKIKMQLIEHPNWKIITLSGNYHNRISDPHSMASVLKRNIKEAVCTLNMEYQTGSAFANFGNGLEIKNLGSYPSVINSTDGYESYLILLPANIYYDYDGFWFIKTITAAKMTSDQ